MKVFKISLYLSHALKQSMQLTDLMQSVHLIQSTHDRQFTQLSHLLQSSHFIQLLQSLHKIQSTQSLHRLFYNSRIYSISSSFSYAIVNLSALRLYISLIEKKLVDKKTSPQCLLCIYTHCFLDVFCL